MKRSILKKMIVLTLAFAMVFSSVITAVSATEAELTATFTATTDKETYAAGDTVVVTFAVTGEVDAIGLTYGYDAGLTFVSAEWIIADAMIADVDLEKGYAAIAFDGAAILSETAVFAMTFTADADGEYVVSATPVMKNGAANVAADTAVATVVVGSSHECVFGDWQSNETSHWKECDCGLKSEEGAHDYANNCDDTCDTCGYVRTVGDHEWGDWIIDTEATVSAAGSKHRVCSCGATETKVIPMKLKMNSVSLTLDSSIAVNFKTNKSFEDIDGYTDLYAVIIKNGKETVIPMDPEKFEKNTGVNKLGRYIFTYKMNPQSLNDDLQVYLYGTYEGELYVSDVLNYNIAQKYCYVEMRKSTAKASFKTLIASLLNYSAACQIKQNYNVINLANADMTAAEQELAISGERTYADCQNTKYTVIDAPTAAFKQVGLELADAVVLRFMATLPSDLTNVKLVAKSGTVVWEVPADEFTFDTASGRYKVLFSGLGAHQMSNEVLFTFYDGDTAISNTFSYSIETYVNKNLASLKNSDSKLADVLVAMINYGDAAVAYKN